MATPRGVKAELLLRCGPRGLRKAGARGFGLAMNEAANLGADRLWRYRNREEKEPWGDLGCWNTQSIPGSSRSRRQQAERRRRLDFHDTDRGAGAALRITLTFPQWENLKFLVEGQPPSAPQRLGDC